MLQYGSGGLSENNVNYTLCPSQLQDLKQKKYLWEILATRIVFIPPDTRVTDTLRIYTKEH